MECFDAPICKFNTWLTVIPEASSDTSCHDLATTMGVQEAMNIVHMINFDLWNVHCIYSRVVLKHWGLGPRPCANSKEGRQ